MRSFVVILKESIIISALVNIVKAFMTSYENSRLKKSVNAAALCFKNSATYGVLLKYANKKPYYRYSFTYKIIMAVAGLFDRLFAAINSLVKKWFSGSKTAEETLKAYRSDVQTKLGGFGILFMSIPIGSIIALIYAGRVSAMNMVMCWSIFIAGLLCVVISYCKDALKNSIFIKGIARFVDLIR